MAAETSLGGKSGLPPRAGSPAVAPTTAKAPAKKQPLPNSADIANRPQRGQRQGGRGGRNQQTTPPRGGWEAFLDSKIAESGSLQGSNSKRAARFTHGSGKGLEYGRAVEKFRGEYAKMSPDQRKQFEDRANMRDVRSGEERDAESRYTRSLQGRGGRGRVAQNEVEVDEDEGGPTDEGLAMNGDEITASELERPMKDYNTGLQFKSKFNRSLNA